MHHFTLLPNQTSCSNHYMVVYLQKNLLGILFLMSPFFITICYRENKVPTLIQTCYFCQDLNPISNHHYSHSYFHRNIILFPQVITQRKKNMHYQNIIFIHNDLTYCQYWQLHHIMSHINQYKGWGQRDHTYSKVIVFCTYAELGICIISLEGTM